MPEEFKIKLTDKPHLSKALQENPQAAKEVIATFTQLMEEAFAPEKSIIWSDLPKKFHPQLTFSMLIKGILRGSLDVKDIDPDTYAVFFEEVHPLSRMSTRANPLGGNTYSSWRKHFQVPEDTRVNEEVIADLFRKMLRYTKYIDIQTLHKYLDVNQIATYRGLGLEQVEKLPFYPALRFQRANFGELHVGTFFVNIGFFDCGPIASDTEDCPACQRPNLKTIGKYKCCLECNSGFDPVKEF